MILGRDDDPLTLLLARVAVTSAVRDAPGLTATVDIDCGAIKPFRAGVDLAFAYPRPNPRPRRRDDLSPTLSTLRPGGIVVAQRRAAFLVGQDARGARRRAARESQPIVVALLNDPGGAAGLLVLRRPDQVPAVHHPSGLLGWSRDEASSSMMLRRVVGGPTKGSSARSHSDISTWSLDLIMPSQWRRRPTWSSGPRPATSLATRLEVSGVPTIGRLFTIRPGVKTVDAPTLLIGWDTWQELPTSEQRYFVPAIDGHCLHDGRVVAEKRLFRPPSEWETEADVAAAMPIYYQWFLWATKDVLTARRGIAGGRWWLAPTSTAADVGPRLIAKREGLVPAFAFQWEAAGEVVEANAWYLRPSDISTGVDQEGLLRIYSWILNSRLMQHLLREYCPTGARKYLNLNRSYVKRVPIGDVARVTQEDTSLRDELAARCREHGDTLPPMQLRDWVTAQVWGISIE
jgi:hypothetical protein